MVNYRLGLGVAVVAAISSTADAHSRFMYPPPRDLNSGIKTGPCGTATQPTQPTALAPGWHTIAFVETIQHLGTPWRIALSEEGVDGGYESCILLNHIPHFDVARPVGDTLPLRINVLIPDVDCKKCTLQLLNAMTDKIQDPSCIYDPAKTTAYEEGLCFSNYHSCADVTITGTTPRDQAAAICKEPDNWPYRAGQTITTEAGTSAAAPLVFHRGEATTWGAEWIAAPGLPADYTTPQGPGATATATVVPPPAQDGPVPGNPTSPPDGGVPGTTTTGPTTPDGQPAATGAGDNTTLYIGIGAGGAVVLGGLAYMATRGKSSGGGMVPLAPPKPGMGGGAPPGWKQASDPVSGRTYYYNAQGQTSWTRPN